MAERITYHMLKPKGTQVYGVHCGLVRGPNRRRILGCGKLATKAEPHKQFYYKSRYGTLSTVSLCPKCAKKAAQ